MLMAGRSEFDEHEAYVANRAAVEIAEKLGIDVVGQNNTLQQTILRKIKRQLGNVRALKFERVCHRSPP